MDSVTVRCAEAVVRIDQYLRRHQKSGAYEQWLARYTKNPSDHDDAFLFGKLVQAMFSGGMKGQVVDAWMPRMEKAFHQWDVHAIAGLSDEDLDRLARSGEVIANRAKLKGVVSNARMVLGLNDRHGSFGRYIRSFHTVGDLSQDLSRRFSHLGEVTTEDFLRNIGFDTIKPDRHVTRWLTRMGAVASPDASAKEVLEVSKRIADAAKLSKAHFDAAIYLFCADRDDVIAGGICGNTPRCGDCPTADLCPGGECRSESSMTAEAEASKPTEERPVELEKSSRRAKPSTNTVWGTCYAGKSLEEIECINPFATNSWLEQPYGSDGSRERRADIIKLFDGKAFVDMKRIQELGSNKGRYPAFRAIVHGYAAWEGNQLRRCREN